MAEIRRERCLACGGKLGNQPLMQFDGMPASAQDIPDAGEVKTDRGISLNLYQCSDCGLVQFDCPPVAYYRDVIRSGGFTTTMVELRRRQYRHLIDFCRLEGKKILEAGCGRGEFLSVLREFPVQAYGIEHLADLVSMAQEQGLRVWRMFPETEDTVLASADFDAAPPYDAFLSFNFLEHQPDPGTMLRCIRNNLSDGGVGLVTVPSLEYILQYNGYYELIRDHLAYYSFGTLRRLLEHNGFQVLEEELVNRDTLSVIVRKADFRETGTSGFDRLDISGLAASRRDISRDIDSLLERLAKQGKTLAVWGASHQGFTLAATTGVGKTARYIMDSAPFKQNRFAPASHLPIVAPDHFYEEPVDAILIVAPGYTDEIAGIIRQKYCGREHATEIWTLRSNKLEEITEA